MASSIAPVGDVTWCGYVGALVSLLILIYQSLVVSIGQKQHQWPPIVIFCSMEVRKHVGASRLE